MLTKLSLLQLAFFPYLAAQGRSSPGLSGEQGTGDLYMSTYMLLFR